MSVNLDKLVEELSKLTVMEAAELSKKLEEHWGVSAVAPVATVAPVAGGGGVPTEEQTEFDIILTSFGEKKIEVIKVVRTITSLGLKEAKDLVEAAPKPIKEKIKKEEAIKIKADLEAVGAKVEMK